MSNSTKIIEINKNIQIPDVKIFYWGESKIINNWNVGTSNIPFWRLYYNSTPGALFYFDDEVVALDKDNILLLPPYVNFKTRIKQPFDHFHIHFIAKGIFNKVKRDKILIDAKPFVKKIKREFKLLISFELNIYSLLFDILSNIPLEKFQDEYITTLDSRIEAALEYIALAKHYNISNNEICKKVGMSISSFQTIFKREIGISPQNYLLRIRMDRAYDLLVCSNLSIPEIAEHVNFSNRFQFSKAFKQYFNISPAKIKNIYKY